MNEALHRTGFERRCYCLVEALGHRTLRLLATVEAEHILERLVLREVLEDQLMDLLNVLRLGIDDSVRACIISVRSLDFASLLYSETVVLDDQTDDRPANIVHVENGWFGIESDGVEGVAVLHGDTGKGVEVLVLDSFGDLCHTSGDDLLDTVLQEGASLDGALHAGSGRGTLLGVTHDTNKSVKVWPVRLRCDLDGERVRAGRVGALFPSDKAAVKGAAGRTRTLAGNGREGARWAGKLIESTEGGDKGSKTRC